MQTPDETEWTTITYHPEPTVMRFTRGDDDVYWKGVHPGCTFEIVEEDLGFMKHLVGGVKVRIVPHPDEMQTYVEPLARIHTEFWEAASSTVSEMYPWKNKRRWKYGSVAHTALADVYWTHANDFERYTPQEWVSTLNAMLSAISDKTNQLTGEYGEVEALKEKLHACWKTED